LQNWHAAFNWFQQIEDAFESEVRLAHAVESFVPNRKTSIAAQPSKGAFDDPARTAGGDCHAASSGA
jgi:hypothetical protein